MNRIFQDDGVELRRDDVRVVDFLQKNPKYDFLRVYHLEEKIIIEENRVFISNNVIAEFNSAQLARLKLPPRYPHLFTCQASGAVLQDDYHITPVFKTKSGRPLGYYKQRKGTFISFPNKKKYTLSPEIYEALQLIAKINNTADHGLKLALVHQLKIIEIKINNSSALEDIDVSTPSHFSLRVSDKDNFTALPVFLKKSSAEQTDIDAEELDAEQDDNFEDLLPQKQTAKFHEYFQNKKRIAPHMQLDDNKFLVLDDKMRKIVQTIKDAHVSKTIAARRALYANPNTYLRKEIGEESSEELDDAFIPDEHYMSERVSHIGEWQAKAQAFVPSQHNAWIPQDLAGIRLDNEIIYLNPKRIDVAVAMMQAALQAQEPTVIIEGQEVQATAENIELLQQASVNYKKDASFQQEKLAETQAEEKGKTRVIIKDNIDDELFQEGEVYRDARAKYLPHRLITTPYPYQRDGLSWLQEAWNRGRRGVLLADDMGLGKTLQVLAFLAWLQETAEQQKPFLIVMTVTLLKNWQAEHDRHLHAPGLGKIVVAHGTELTRIKNTHKRRGAIDYFASADVVITTYDSLARNEDIFGAVAWHTMVLDECQYIKNPDAYRAQMAKAMDAQFSIAMTGTPVENSLIDLWCIADTVHPGILGTLKEFNKKYVKQKNGADKLHDKLTKDIIPPFFLRRMKEECLQGLPPKQEIILRRDMPDPQKDEYDSAVANVKKNAPDSKIHMFQALRRMQDISLCPLAGYEADNDKDFIEASARLSLLFEVLDQIKARAEKVLIFLQSRKMLGKLSAVIQRYHSLKDFPPIINGEISVAKRQRIVDDFQKLPQGFAVLLISPKVGGVGLNITNANNVIHLERWWNPAVEDQCNDRVYRIGQQKKVNIYVLIATHPHIKSFDEVLHELLLSKRKLSRAVIMPTTINNKDYEDMLEQTTGCTYLDFYQSSEWLALRDKILAKYGRKCQKCGATPPAVMQVDHIKPRARYPHLQLDPANLQVLCKQCNREKGDKHSRDYRDGCDFNQEAA